ncbi:Uncharacterised protein [uncultured archaeon]|nr:Uncharacterised protein [uncultured archaeon]
MTKREEVSRINQEQRERLTVRDSNPHPTTPMLWVVSAAQSTYMTKEVREKIDGKWVARTIYVPFLGEGSAPLHQNLYDGLRRMMKERDVGSEMLICPTAGKCQAEDVLHESVEHLPELYPAWRKGYFSFNDNIQLSDILVPPQNVDPTTGKTKLPAKYGSTLVFPHSKQRFRPVAVYQADFPRYLLTTGMVTLPNYNQYNAKGDQAAKDHRLGAVLVETIDGNYFNMRTLRARMDGSFVDMGLKYNGDRKPERVKVKALDASDVHIGEHDPRALEATLEQIEFFKPERLILHDFFSGYSISHHELANRIERARLFRDGKLDLRKELELNMKYLKEFSKAMKGREIYIVHSNHHDFLPKYLNSPQSADDLWNFEMNAMITSRMPRQDGYLEEALKLIGQIPSNVQFLRLSSNLVVGGYQLASHGHLGKNGARGGGVSSQEESFGKGIFGHSHSPEIKGDIYRVGTMLSPETSYMQGASSASMAANGVLYENDTVQLLPMINGKWKAKF